MADKSGISWTEATWQVIAGCTACSPGCRECYSARLCATRFAHLPWAKGLAETITRERILTSEGLHSARIRKVTETLGYRWTGKVICRDDQLAVPLKWRQPKRIFVGDRGDLFHEQVPDGFVMDVWRTMGTCHCHTFLVLTKRPDRMASWIAKWSDVRVEPDWEPKLARGPQATREAHAEGRGQLFADMLERWGEPPAGAAFPTYDWAEGVRWWPNVLQNVWLGTSVCVAAEKVKIDQLRAVPAAHRFLSLEPLLEDLGELDLTGIDQVIVGGESGHKARPCALEWIGSVVKQCQAAGVPCFVKQLGANVVSESRACESVEQQRALGLSSKWAWRAALKSRSGSDPSEWPEDLCIRELGWTV